MGGMESDQEILVAWRIRQGTKEQVSAQDGALMIGMMVRGWWWEMADRASILNECESGNARQAFQNDSEQAAWEVTFDVLTGKRCYLR